LGYNLPTAPYLATYVPGLDIYVLNITFISDWEAGTTIDKHVTKVILPEGSTDIKVEAPFSIESSHERVYTYIDSALIGRPALILSKSNLVNEHYQYFQVTYKFSKINLFLEPALLVAFFFAFFCIIIVLARIDLKISVAKKVPSLDGQLVKSLASIYEDRENIHLNLDEALQNYLKNNEQKVWDKERKEAASKFSDSNKKILELNKKFSKEGISEIVLEIEKNQKQKEEFQKTLHDLLTDYKTKKNRQIRHRNSHTIHYRGVVVKRR